MEIGGYFGLEELVHSEFYKNLVALNTARNCVAYLVKSKRIRKIYIPKYLCDSIYKVCEREGCDYEFYDVGADFQPEFDKVLQDNEWLYVVNYYGQVTNEKELKKKFGNIIFDNVQAFFQKPLDGIDTLYSCRKFFGVPDGAYLSTDVSMDLEQDISKDRMKHVLGRYEKTASEFYNYYTENEDSYYDLPVRSMSKLTHNIMGAIDYKKVKKTREENFQYLFDNLQNINQIAVKIVEGPFAYPFYMKNGLEIKRKLATKGIYVACLWPTAFQFGGMAKDYSENILPLPYDQRYNLEDMKTVCDEVKAYII